MKWRRSERIADEAARWVVLIDSELFDAAAAARFKRWIARSDAHRRAFLLASRAWGELDGLQKLKAYPDIVALLEAGAEVAPRQPAEATGPDRRALLVGAGVAGVGLCVVGYNLLRPAPAAAFASGIGELRELTLADGTIARLNAATRLEAEVTAERRRARVLRGEVLFTIAAREGDAFVISTPSGGVEAAGGDVLVKVLPDGARISLLSQGARAWRAGFLSRENSVSLGPQSEVEFGREDLRVTQADAPLLERRTLWREGRLSFDNAPLSEAVEDVARYTGVRFVFADDALDEMRIGGVINARDLEGFLALLHENLAISATQRDGEIVLDVTH